MCDACAGTGRATGIQAAELDGESLHTLTEQEKVTLSAGVPSIWQGLIAYVEQKGLRFSTMRRTGVGGSAMPQVLIAKFADTYQVKVRHGWGMTETTAVATMGTLTPIRPWPWRLSSASSTPSGTNGP
ncbi:MAG: AMP-binding protein [Burkholderiaceae bacterium]